MRRIGRARRGWGIALACLLVCSAEAALPGFRFEEGFEKPASMSASAYLASRGWYDLANPVITTAESHTGSSSLAYTIQQGQLAAGGMRLQIPPSRTVYLRFARKVPTTWLWPISDHALHDFYVWANASAYQSPTSVPFAYYVEQSSRTVDGVRRNGIAFAQTKNAAGVYTGYEDPQLTPVFTSGVWHVVDATIRMNDPGQANGELTLSVDGALRIRRTGMTFQASTTSLLFDQIFFGPYFHEGARQTQTFWTDDIAISDLPIPDAVVVPLPGWMTGLIGVLLLVLAPPGRLLTRLPSRWAASDIHPRRARRWKTQRPPLSAP